MARHKDVITSQTRTRDRVRDLAEVYTHKREVDAMLDLVPDMFPSDQSPRNIGRTFLEPACGSGNFLVAILERKLAYVTTSVYRTQVTLEAAMLKALSSIYGIDIDESNVEASRGFMKAEIAHHANLQLNTIALGDGFWGAVEAILLANIVCADALNDANDIRFIEWHWERRSGYVTRRWSRLIEREEQADLFAPATTAPDRDVAPLHFSMLESNPNPIRVSRPAAEEASA